MGPQPAATSAAAIDLDGQNGQGGALATLLAELQETWNAHDADRVAALYAAEYEETDIGEAAATYGRVGLGKTVRRTMAAFPDLRLTIDDVVNQGERVAIAWTMRGTHLGPFLRIPPTGRAVTMRGMSLMTIADGKFVRGLRIWDIAGFLRTIKLLPDM